MNRYALPFYILLAFIVLTISHSLTWSNAYRKGAAARSVTPVHDSDVYYTVDEYDYGYGSYTYEFPATGPTYPHYYPISAKDREWYRLADSLDLRRYLVSAGR